MSARYIVSGSSVFSPSLNGGVQNQLAGFPYAVFEDMPDIAGSAFAVAFGDFMRGYEIFDRTGTTLIRDNVTQKRSAIVEWCFYRYNTGQVIIPQKGALRSLVARFRNNGKAAVVLDQNTSEKKGGIMVDFLGLPMRVSPAPAALAYRTGTEIMLGFCLPEEKGRYRIRITQTIVPPPFSKELDPEQVALELTRQILDGISTEIRAHPQYWLWSYKHWRRVEGKSYPDAYPNYDPNH